MFFYNTIEHEREIRRLAGVIESAGSIELRSTRSKDQKIGCPTTAFGLVQQGLGVMRSDRAFQTVQQQDAGRSGGRGQSVDFEKITVGCIPALQYRRSHRLTPKQLAPQRAQVATGNPPGGRIDYVARHG